MNAVIAIAAKDLKLLFRDKGGAFFTLIFPIFVALFFGSIFGGSVGGGGGGRLELAVADEDHSKQSQSFIADLVADDALSVTTESGTPANPLSREQAITMVRKGQASACVIVPKGFGAGAGSVFGGEGMKIEGIVAPGHSAEGGLLTGKLNEIGFKQLMSAFTDHSMFINQIDNARQMIESSKELSPERKGLFESMFSSVDKLSESMSQPDAPRPSKTGDDSKKSSEDAGFSWRPVNVSITELKNERNEPRSAWEISFPQGVVWGLMGCVMAFGSSIATERARGTMQRLAAAPIRRGDILAGKALACFVACMIIQSILLGMAMLVFSVRPTNIAMMGVAMLLSALAFVGVMMLVAGMSRSEGGASGMARALVIILAMVGGGTVPTFLLPTIVQKISYISPFRWASLAMEGAIWRSFSWQDFALPGIVLIAFGIGGFIVGDLALRRGERA